MCMAMLMGAHPVTMSSSMPSRAAQRSSISISLFSVAGDCDSRCRLASSRTSIATPDQSPNARQRWRQCRGRASQWRVRNLAPASEVCCVAVRGSLSRDLRMAEEESGHVRKPKNYVKFELNSLLTNPASTWPAEDIHSPDLYMCSVADLRAIDTPLSAL